jgi:uncharacterized delta-60 repeat protein
MARRLSFASSHRLFVFLTAFGFALWGAAAVHAQAPIITSISSPRQVVVNGDSLTLTVNAIDATGYQWMRNGRLLPGATAATYTLTNAAAYRDAGWYQVAASNGAGAATSPVVFVNVTVNPPEFLVSGQSVGAAPVGLTSASAIASGIGFYVVLKGDGTVVATGSSSSGVLSLPAGLSSVVGISANGSQCVALKSDGTVVTWGVGVTAPPPAGLSNIVQVAAGGNHVLALKADRSVVAWGANYSGQTNVPAGLSGVIAVAASPFHSVALKADGTVVAWGMNDVGQATVPAGLSNVVALSANFAHTLALKSDGTVVGWGTSFLGRASPPAGLVAVAIGAGAYHSVALKADGTAVGWGYNASGESTFSAAATKIVAIAPGDSTTLLLRDGAIPGLPILTSQPANAVSMLGGSAAFTVGAAGTGLTYQWFHNGAAVAGATGATLSLTNLQTADVGNYYVTITGSAGSVTSATATLTGANAAPSIPTQPANLTVISGQAATFSVTATGSGTLTYQWRQNGFPISGATSASYPLAAARRTDADFYDVQVFDGLAFTVSHAARLSVAPTAYSGFVAPDPAWSLRPESMGNGQIYFAASLSDGRTYIAGAYSSVDGVRRTSLSRVNADGTLDSSFVPPEIDSQVLTLAVQADGKLLLGGDFLRVDGVLSKRLARLHSDGRLDTSFNVGAAVNGGVNALAVQADGKVLVCGGFIGFAGSTRNYVVRLNTDGSLDSGFLTRGMGSVVRSVLVQGDGKIVLGGNFTTYVDHNGTTMACTRLARLNADGTLDTSFSPAPNAGVSTLAVQGDGKIIAGGSFTFVGSTATRRVCRINSDGTLDAAFSTGTGTGFNFDVNTVALQADGKILVGGGFTTFAGVAAMNLIRLNSSGSRDTGFLSKGMDSTVNVVAPS